MESAGELHLGLGRYLGGGGLAPRTPTSSGSPASIGDMSMSHFRHSLELGPSKPDDKEGALVFFLSTASVLLS